MTDSFEASERPAVAPGSPARWPSVVGTIGLVVGVLIFVDKLDDLLFLPLLTSVDWWKGLLGDEIGEMVMRVMPPTGWILGSSLVGMSLGALLVVGSWRLRRARRSAVKLCRAWAWLALAWLLLEVGGALYWLSRHLGEIERVAPGGWQGEAVLGTVLVVAVLAAFPVFLLGWLSRADVQEQAAGWPP